MANAWWCAGYSIYINILLNCMEIAIRFVALVKEMSQLDINLLYRLPELGLFNAEWLGIINFIVLVRSIVSLVAV